MTDQEVIDLILKGDREKFGILVERYQQMVFRICMGYVHNHDDADDLVQEIFIQAYQSLSRFKGDSAFSTWLYRVAVNASLNKIRKPLKSIFSQTFDSIAGSKEGADYNFNLADFENPESIIIRQEHTDWLNRALDSLPENQRTAIILSKYDDLPQKEIAGIMRISEGAVESLLQRAKKNLRERLLKSARKRSE